MAHLGKYPCFKEYLKGNILDAGCGNDKYPNAFGIDIVKTDVTDTVGNVENMRLIFPDNQFDSIYCNNVIEHLDYPQMAFNEFYRILKVGGYAVIKCPARAHSHFYDDFSHIRPYPPVALTKLAENAGFKVEVAVYTGIPGFSFVPNKIAFALGKLIKSKRSLLIAQKVYDRNVKRI